MLAALSSGEEIDNPRPGEDGAKVLRRAQRALARKKQGSKGRRNARAFLRHVHRRIANRRRTHLDRVSSRLVKHFGLVAVEKMHAEQPGETLPEFVKRRRNREALDAAPYLLRQMLTYKARRERAELIVVDPKHTTQQCSMCGELHFKKLSQAEHICTTPGLFFGRTLPRKVNAARVILQRALTLAVEDRGGLIRARGPSANACWASCRQGHPSARGDRELVPAALRQCGVIRVRGDRQTVTPQFVASTRFKVTSTSTFIGPRISTGRLTTWAPVTLRSDMRDIVASPIIFRMAALSGVEMPRNCVLLFWRSDSRRATSHPIEASCAFSSIRDKRR